MAFREYGQRSDNKKWTDYLPAAGLIAGGIALAIGAKPYARRLIAEAGESQLKHILANELGHEFRSVVERDVTKILAKPIGYREAISTVLGNNPVMRAWEWASERVMPINIVDRLLNLESLRLTAKTKVMMTDEFRHLTKGLSSEAPLLYARGGIYEVTKTGLNKKIDDVYPVTGGLSYLIDKINRETPTGKKADGIVGFLKNQLDIGNVRQEKKSFWQNVSDFTKASLGLSDYKDYEQRVQFLKAAHPVKDIKNLITDLAAGNITGAISRLSPGRSFSLFGKEVKLPTESLKDLSIFHLTPYHMLNRMNQQIKEIPYIGKYIGLSDKSTRSALDLYSSIGLKRLLPIYVGYEYAKYLNYESGKLTGKDLEQRWGEMRASASLGVAHVKDITGITSTTKWLNKISPKGMLQPFSDQPVGLSHDELLEYFKSGREATRRGKWWWFGSGEAFKGGKIDHFVPNWYQRSKSEFKDYKYTDVLYGSKEEYWKHSLLPTLRYPLSPLKALTDSYWLENKHYKDRPYPKSSPMFTENIYGTVLNATVGALIKPTKNMHRGELSSALRCVQGVNEAIQSRFTEYGKRNYQLYVSGGGQITPMETAPVPGSLGSLPYGGGISSEIQAHDPAKGGSFGSMESDNNSLSAGQEVGPYSYDGAKQTVRGNLEAVNRGIAEKGYRRQVGVPGKVTDVGVLMHARYPRPEYAAGPFPELLSRANKTWDATTFAKSTFDTTTELAGMYGFGLRTAMKGLGINVNVPHLEQSRMASFSDDFHASGIGSITKEFGEIARRFVPRHKFDDIGINPIVNQIPSWLPSNYSTDFHKGDPYSRLSGGEYRLPGAGYERMHGIDPGKLEMRGSMMGASKEEITQYLLGMREGTTYMEEETMQRGTDIHKQIQKELKDSGLLIEGEKKIYNEKYNISGTIDALVNGEKGPEIVEIKTKASSRKFDEMDVPEQKHVEQLMSYMGTTGIHSGYLQYVDANNTKKKKIFRIPFQQEVFEASLNKVEEARNTVREMINSGAISKQELYSPFERFRILADVAPYSQEYEYYKNFLSSSLEEGSDQRKEFSSIKEEVTAKKSRVELEPYKFKYADIKRKSVVVSKVLEPGVFLAVGHGAPIRLAGVNPLPKTSELYTKSQEKLSSFIYPGAILRIGVDADEKKLVERDVYGSTHAAVWTIGGTNVGKELLKEGYATEKETDDRPAAIHSRFTSGEIFWGKQIEAVAHMNIPYIHNKFMPIDSPLEEYKRKEIYGKRFTQWDKPIESIVVPAIRAYAAEGVVAGAAEGAFIGFFMGRMKPAVKGVTASLMSRSKYKLIGAGIGAAVGAVSAMAMRMFGTSKRAYIPDNIRRRRKIDTYYDRIKYMKFRRLYEATRRKIKSTEHIDIEAMARAIEMKGKSSSERVKYLKELKRRDKIEGVDSAEINDEIKAITENRRRIPLTPLDSMALQFRQEYKSTMYGLDPAGKYEDLYRALPATERDYVKYFLEAPKPERNEILRLVPDDIRTLLKNKWDGTAYKTQPLAKFFNDKFMPPSNWAGWLPTRSLEDYKAATLEAEGFDLREQGIWPTDLERMREQGIKDISPFRASVHKKIIGDSIRHMYNGLGLDNVIVNIYSEPSDRNSIDVNVNVLHNREEQIEEYVRENGHKIFG